MRHVIKNGDHFIDLSPEAIEARRQLYGNDYYSVVAIDGEDVHVAWTDADITARQREEALPPPKPPVLEQLQRLFQNLDTGLQASLGPTAASVLMFVQFNNLDAARLVIQQAAVPSELEPIRQELLECFD